MIVFCLVGLQHDQRPEIVVPVGHEDDDDGRRIGRAHHRHVDEQEDLPFLEPVDLGGVPQFGREGLGGLAEIEDDEGRARWSGSSDRQVRVDQPRACPSSMKQRHHQRGKRDRSAVSRRPRYILSR